MNKYLSFLIASAVFFITGCSGTVTISSPTDEMIKTSDYGTKPATVKQDLQDYFDTNLKDPHSVKLKPITEPEKGYIYFAKETPWTGDDRYVDVEFKPVFGWMSCATYNAKNSYGGYVGWKMFVIFYQTGKSEPLFIEDEFANALPEGLIDAGWVLPYIEPKQGCVK